VVSLKSNAYRILIGKLLGKRPILRPRKNREDNIKMDLMETGCELLEMDETISGLCPMAGCRTL
jgi:hypothetical protein